MPRPRAPTGLHSRPVLALPAESNTRSNSAVAHGYTSGNTIFLNRQNCILRTGRRKTAVGLAAVWYSNLVATYECSGKIGQKVADASDQQVDCRRSDPRGPPSLQELVSSRHACPDAEPSLNPRASSSMSLVSSRMASVAYGRSPTRERNQANPSTRIR